MDRTQAEQRMLELLGPAADLLTPNDIDYALDMSLTWDDEGRAPGEDGYVDTYDPWWAAAEAAGLLAMRAQAQGGVVEFSSEGSTFKRSEPDFWAMSRYLRSRSPMSPQYGGRLGSATVNGRLANYRSTSSQYRGGGGIIGNWS